MKLIDLLTSLDEGTQIKIGTTDGNSFFYADVIHDGTIDIIKAIGKPSYGKMMKNIEKCEKVIKRLENSANKCDCRTLTVNREKLSRLLAFKDRYTDILHREIVDSFIADTCVEPIRTLVVIIDGWEIGQYWTIEECQRKKGA